MNNFRKIFANNARILHQSGVSSVNASKYISVASAKPSNETIRMQIIQVLIFKGFDITSILNRWRESKYADYDSDYAKNRRNLNEIINGD